MSRVPAARRHEAGIKRGQIGLAGVLTVVVAHFVPGHVDHFARSLGPAIGRSAAARLAGLQSLDVDIVDQQHGREPVWIADQAYQRAGFQRGTEICGLKQRTGPACEPCQVSGVEPRVSGTRGAGRTTPSAGARNVSRSTSRRRSLKRRSLSASAARAVGSSSLASGSTPRSRSRCSTRSFRCADFAFGSRKFELDFRVVERANHVAAADRFAGRKALASVPSTVAYTRAASSGISTSGART